MLRVNCDEEWNVMSTFQHHRPSNRYFLQDTELFLEAGISSDRIQTTTVSMTAKLKIKNWIDAIENSITA